MTVSFDTLRQAAAGVEHVALLDEYLRQPLRRWQAGATFGPGACYLPASTDERVRGSRRYSGTRRLRVRDFLALAAPVIERQARASIMAAARQTERERQASGRAGWEALPTLVEAFAADVARGTLPRFSAKVTEARRVPHPSKGRGHWLDLGVIEARGWQVWQERLYLDYLAGWRTVEATMRQAGKGGATLLRAPSSVNAPSIHASRRQRVSDSHDARPASERGSVRQYSRIQFGRDVASGKPRTLRESDTRDGHDGGCRVIRVSSRRLRERGTAAALAAAQGGGRQWEAFSRPESAGKGKRRSQAVSAAAARSARLRAIAGTLGVEAQGA